MAVIEFDEYEIALENLERIRVSLVIEMKEIDQYAGLGKNAYSRFISKKQSIKLEELISIGKNLFNLRAAQILTPDLEVPVLDSLPSHTKSIVQSKKGKTPRVQEKRDINFYCILILNKHFKIGDDFVNSQIKGHLSDELQIVFKGKSIEWNKSSIAEYILDTQTTRTAKTKPEKVYKLVKKLPANLVKEAKEIVGEDWLENVEE